MKKIYKSFGVLFGLILLMSACVISLDDSYNDPYDQWGYWDDSDTNVIQITNDGAEAVTNTQVVTNSYVHVLDISTLSPTLNETINGSFTFEAEVLNTSLLEGAIIYVESTNSAIVSADYSSITDNQFSAQITVSHEGYYYVWSTAWDTTGAIGQSEKIAIMADWTAPTLTINEPLEDIIIVRKEGDYNPATLTLSGTAFDAIAGIEAVYIQGSLCAPVMAATGTENWSATVSLNEGTNSITVFAADKAGYVSQIKTLSVIVE